MTKPVDPHPEDLDIPIPNAFSEIPGTLTRNAIVACCQWLDQLTERERGGVLAFLRSWYS